MTTDKTLLVLDVDETLVHTVDTTKESLPDRPADFLFGKNYHVYLRPHLQTFLGRCESRYTLAVWSAGGRAYIDFLLPRLFKNPHSLAFAWSSNRCGFRRLETGEAFAIKDLKKVKKRGFRLERTLLVEDTPANGSRQYGNVVAVRPYMGEQDDDELLKLATYLEKLYHRPNFRTVEKRGWRSRV